MTEDQFRAMRDLVATLDMFTMAGGGNITIALEYRGGSASHAWKLFIKERPALSAEASSMAAAAAPFLAHLEQAVRVARQRAEERLADVDALMKAARGDGR